MINEGQLAWVPSNAKLWMTNCAGSTYRYTYVNTPKYVVVTEADCANAWSCSKVFFDGEHWFINNKDVFPTETKED